MKRLNQNSIRHRFTLGLVTIITGIVFLFSIALILYNSRSVEKQLHNQMNKIMDFSQKSLSIALWQYNNDYIKEYINSLFLYEDIVFASVIVKNNELEKKSRPEEQALLFSDFTKSTKYIAAESTIKYKEANVGTLRLVLSRERISDLVISTSSLSIFILFIVNLSVLGLNYVMSDRHLFRPLSKLEGSVKSISDGKLDVKIDTSSDDEIGQLAKSFEQMMINLKRITASRDELNHEIKERIRTEKRIEGLSLLKESLLGADPLDDKLKLITDGVVDILNADFVRIWLIKKGDNCFSGCRHVRTLDKQHICQNKTKCLHLVASSGRYTQVSGSHERIPFGCYKIGELASSDGHGFITNDVIHDPRIHHQEWAQKIGLVSFAGYRLVSAKGETIGVLAIFSKNKLSTKDDTLLQTISSTASEVIQISISQDMLQKSERKYRRLFENAQIGMFRSRVNDGKIIESNYRMAQIFGYDSPAECISNYIADNHYVYPEQRKIVVEKLKNNGEISNFEIQVRLNDGSLKWIQFSGRLSENENYFEGVSADITERKHAEKKVLASLKEKEVLFKEIHHRVKNNMQIIQSLISLQLNEIKGAEHKKPLIDSNNRIKSMALIHEILYRSDDMAVLDLETYFKEIAQHLFKIYLKPEDDVTLNIDVASINLDMDLSIACGLISNELVSNALKYAFISPGVGSLSISLNSISDNEVRLVIRDNGHGLPDDFDLNTIDSLGLKIVNILVIGQLKGKMNAKTENGAVFDIRFPLSTG